LSAVDTQQVAHVQYSHASFNMCQTPSNRQTEKRTQVCLLCPFVGCVRSLLSISRNVSCLINLVGQYVGNNVRRWWRYCNNGQCNVN